MIRTIPNMKMTIDPNARIAENATLVGEVEVGSDASIWYGAVLRGDSGAIKIGRRSAIEDNVTVHSSTTVGNNVIVGHNAVIHGCTIEDGCLIGMSATVMSGAVVGAGSLVAAGCLITQGTIIPPNSLVMGAPAKVIRPISDAQRKDLCRFADEYVQKAEMQLLRWDEQNQ